MSLTRYGLERHDSTFTSIIAQDGIGRGRGAVNPLGLDESMVDQQSRTLQCIGLCVIAGECSSTDRAEQIAWKWIADGGLRYKNRDGAIGIKITPSRRCSHKRFDWNSDQADHGRNGAGHDFSVIKGGS